MSLTTDDPFMPGRRLSAKQLNDIRKYAKALRRPNPNVYPNQPGVKQSINPIGPQQVIDTYPTLYRVVSTSEGAEQSSSSSGSGADIEVSVKRVDASTGTTYGPALRVKVIE